MIRWLILFPLSIIYSIIVSVRNKLYDFVFKTHKFDFPVISVGNITVGGTGKTPHIEYLVSILKEKFKVATLSRGYKRKTKGFLIANNKSTIQSIGDEPKQIKQKFKNIDVAVDADRVNGIKTLKKTLNNLEVVLLDDAFQHRKVTPGLSILLIDFNRPIFEDRILPMGRLRESSLELKRANIILVTKTPKTVKPIEIRIFTKNVNAFPYQNLYFTSMKYGDFISVFSSNKTKFHKTICKNKKYTILLITGIANPKPLVDYLYNYTEEIIHIKYNDHHTFTAKDIKEIINKFNAVENTNKVLITTEKDAMRLRDIPQKKLPNMSMLKKNFYYLPIEVDFLNEKDKEQFNKNIIDYVKSTSGVSRSDKQKD